MTSSDEAVPLRQRRSGSLELAEKLTAERNQLWSLYCRVAGFEPFNDENNRKSVQGLLQDLCQLLVDYLGLGHFCLYQRIDDGTERRREIRELAADVYPPIAGTTKIAMDFQDKYDCGDHCEIHYDFKDDLSKLGEALATRIELEDRLLKVLC